MDSSTRHWAPVLTIGQASARRATGGANAPAGRSTEPWMREGPIAGCPQDVSAPALGLPHSHTTKQKQASALEIPDPVRVYIGPSCMGGSNDTKSQSQRHALT
jgi:hypothetical protein